MTKSEALQLLGGSLTSAALRIGVTKQAVCNWPNTLTPRQRDRVQAVLYRDLLRDKAAHRLPATTCNELECQE